MSVANAVTAPVAAPVSGPPPIAEPSAAERLFSGLGALWRNLTSLEPTEVVVNLGLSILVIGIVILVVAVLRRVLHQGIEALTSKEGAPAAKVDAKGRPKVAKLTWGLVRFSLVVVAVLTLLAIWGIDIIGWLTTTGVGATLSRLVGIILITVALVEAAGFGVNRILRALASRTQRGRRNAQVKTLGPLIRAVIQGFILVIASLTILSELGVQIGPLLASAGVVGVAVGFGSQTLVKDFLTGLFLVVEDIVAVGDDVSVGDRSGIVEAMSLRTLRLRDGNGSLHILPYSEAQVITNKTKSYSAYLFTFFLSYDADVDQAFEIMARIGAEMQADKAFAPHILQPLEIFGVDQLAESAVKVMARFRTKPGQQAPVGREFNRRVKKAFDAEGVPFSTPSLTLLNPRGAPVDQAQLADLEARPQPVSGLSS